MSFFSWLFHRGNDLTTQFLPDALFFKESILTGRLPVWNPWIFAGMPYLLDPQNFLWYPPNYILLFLPLELGFFILLVGHLILAAWFMAKVSNPSPRWGGWLAAAMFVFSPKLVAHLEEGNWTLVVAACWLPALYYGLVKFQKGLSLQGQSFTDDKKYFWLVVFSLAAIIINNLNTGYYAVLFAVLFFLKGGAPLGALAKWGRPHLINIFNLLIIVALLTLPRWLPLGLYGSLTVRADLNESPQPFWSWSKILKSFLMPLTGGHPQLQNWEIIYLGIVPLILLLLLTLRLKKERFLTSFWIIWLGFVTVVTLNIKTPLFSLIKWLPGFSLLRVTTRPWIFTSLAVALFVPAALSKLAKRSKLAAMMAVLLVLLILIEYGWFARELFARREIPRPAAPWRFYERIVASTPPVRIYCTTGCLDRLTAQRMGIALLGGNNPVQLTEFVKYLQQAGGYEEPAYHPILPPYTVFNSQPQPEAKLLGKTATRFVVSPYELLDDQFELVDQEGEYRLYQNQAEIVEFKNHYFDI